jgi:hypothetical protein
MCRARLVLVLLWALVVAAGGCSRAKPVRVEITLDNKPVEGATVNLSGDAKGVDLVSGVTGPDGVATLDSPKRTGVPPGTHKVIVTKFPKRTEAAPDPKDTEAVKKMMMGSASAGSKNELPAKYASSRDTPLTLKVPPDSSPAKLELKANP